jgi:hypothetical protein
MNVTILFTDIIEWLCEHGPDYLLIVIILILTLVACTDYDHDTPNTAANLAGFERHIGFAAPADVSQVYYFADEMGADVLYQLGFETSPQTVTRIVDGLALEPATDAYKVGRNLAYDLPWWDEADIQQAALYRKTNAEQDYWWALWYSEATGHAYYFEYSL